MATLTVPLGIIAETMLAKATKAAMKSENPTCMTGAGLSESRFEKGEP